MKPAVLKGRIRLVVLEVEHPMRLVVSRLKKLASIPVKSSAMKVIEIKVHCVYFHWVLTTKSMEVSLSLLVGLMEKNRSIDACASNLLTATATPGLFWNGWGRE